MTTYYIDSSKTGGANNGTSWTDAWLSIGDMLADGVGVGTPLATGDIVYVASDSVDTFTYTGNITVVGPSSGAPAKFISVTTGTTTYAASTTNQIDTVHSGAYQITFDGSFAFYGIKFRAGNRLQFSADTNETFLCVDCTMVVPDGNYDIYLGNTYGSFGRLENCNISTSDTATRTATVVGSGGGHFEIVGCTFTSCSYRTTQGIGGNSGTTYEIYGCDLTGFPSYSGSSGLFGGSVEVIAAYCDLPSIDNSNLKNSASGSLVKQFITNCKTADAPESLVYFEPYGRWESSSTVYRDGGAQVEGQGVSWTVFTGSDTGEQSYVGSPWIYGVLSGTGTKTFSAYLASATGGDLYDDEVWLEVEVMATADVGMWSRSSDQRATITTTHALQDDDTVSTWTGISETTMQKLAVANVTVGETGLYRARFVVAKPSVSINVYYFDPKIIVS